MEAEKGQLEVNSERNAQEMKDRSVSLGEILIGDPLSDRSHNALIESNTPIVTTTIHQLPNKQNSSPGNQIHKTKFTSCCCVKRRKKEHIIFDVKNMKTRYKWARLLKKLSLAVKVINILKGSKKDKEIDGIVANSQHYEHHDIPKLPICILHPNSNFVWFWMILIISLLIWTAIYVPYRLAFIDQASFWLFTHECIMDGIFLFDIVFNFFTAYYDQNNNVLITDRRIITKNYLKSWFLIDLLSSFPFQLIDPSIKINKAVRLLRLPRIYRMLKIFALVKIFNLSKSSKLLQKILFKLKLHSGLARLGQVLIIMILYMHLYSCLWYYIAKFEGFQPDCWIVIHGMLDSSNMHKYFRAFYWVLQTTTTVGYGDMGVGNDTELLLAIILMIFGVGFYSYTIGNLSSIMSTMDGKQMKLNSKILALNEFAASLKMPHTLYFKILHILKRNAEASYFNFLDQEALLEELPAAIKTEVLGITHKKILDSFVFFKGKNPQFVMDILPEFKHISLAPNEIIYRKEDWFEEIYFVLKGRVGFITNDGYLFRNYVTGSYFGDIEHFKGKSFRVNSAITYEETELLAIKRVELDKILENYPEIRGELNTVAIQRYTHNKSAAHLSKKTGFRINDDILRDLNEGTGAELYQDFYRKLSRCSFDDPSEHTEHSRGIKRNTISMLHQQAKINQSRRRGAIVENDIVPFDPRKKISQSSSKNSLLSLPGIEERSESSEEEEDLEKSLSYRNNRQKEDPILSASESSTLGVELSPEEEIFSTHIPLDFSHILHQGPSFSSTIPRTKQLSHSEENSPHSKEENMTFYKNSGESLSNLIRSDRSMSFQSEGLLPIIDYADPSQCSTVNIHDNYNYNYSLQPTGNIRENRAFILSKHTRKGQNKLKEKYTEEQFEMPINNLGSIRNRAMSTKKLYTNNNNNNNNMMMMRRRGTNFSEKNLFHYRDMASQLKNVKEKLKNQERGLMRRTPTVLKW